MTIDELGGYLNDTRGFEVDPVKTAMANDNLEIDGDVVRVS